MSPPSAPNLNRLMIGLFFLGAGTFGAFLGLQNVTTGPRPSAEPVQDRVVSSSAGASRTDFKELEMKAETGAIIKIGTVVPGGAASGVPSDPKGYSREQWEELLKDAPMDLLRKHYHDQLEKIGRESIDERFPPVATLENGAIENEILRHAFEAQQSEGRAYWIAQTRISLGGKDQPVSLLVSFYNSRNSVGPWASPSQGSVAGEVCWHLQTFFVNLPDRPAVGSSACLSDQARRKGDRYFIVQNLNLDGVESVYNTLAVEIPFRGKLVPFNASSSSELELLETQTRKWKSQGQISWTQIEPDEAERYEAEFRTRSAE